MTDESLSGLPWVGLVGVFQSGKSTLANCLLKRAAAVSGDFLATTRCSTYYSYGKRARFFACKTGDSGRELSLGEYLDLSRHGTAGEDAGIESFRVELPAEILKSVILVDTAGFDNNGDDDESTLSQLEKFDFVLLVLQNKIDQREEAIVETLHRKSVPFAVINNVAGRGNASNDPFAANNLATRENIANIVSAHCPWPIGDEAVLNVNALWQWYFITRTCSAPGGESDDEKFNGIGADIAKLSLGELNSRSNVSSLACFLTGRSCRICTVSSYTRLQRVFKCWQSSLFLGFDRVIKLYETESCHGKGRRL